MVTLWPSFPHFPRFAGDMRLSGIRLNSAMMDVAELDTELELVRTSPAAVPLYFDVKGRQLRVEEVYPDRDHLDLRLNHPINVRTPVPVLFKAGADRAMLERVEEGGRRLIFHGGPKFMVKAGESLHIRDMSLEVHGDQFSQLELEKIEKVRRAGFTKYFLSYVETERDVDEFLSLVGRDVEVELKIENKKGLQFVADTFKKRDNLSLVAARGDLYVEVDRPHHILDALKLIIAKDPHALVGSRLMLSVVGAPAPEIRQALAMITEENIDAETARKILMSVIAQPVPSCADFCEAAWLYDIGYRRMMLCDELCLKEELLVPAVNAFHSFRNSYAKK